MHIYAKVHIMSSMDIPFVVGRPVTGKYFIGREEELKKITVLLSAETASNIALLAQRRTGKSSILYNLKEQDTGRVHVIFDAYGMSTKERFAKAYMTAVSDACAKTGDSTYGNTVKKMLASGADRLKDSVSNVDVTALEIIKFHVKFGEQETDPDDLLEDALRFAGRLAEDKGIRLAVMIDEFQELLKWGESFLKTFRSVMQSQQGVSYVLSGSAPTIMQGLVYDSESPLYRQLVEIRLNKLPDEDTAKFVGERLASAGIRADGGVPEYVFEMSRGYADYVQRIGLHLFMRCIRLDSKSVSRSDVNAAYEEMLIQLDADFGTAFSRRADLEKEILLALAMGRTSISAISREIRRPQSSIPKTLNRLVASDIVERDSLGGYRIADGVLSDWIHRRPAAWTSGTFRSSYTP